MFEIAIILGILIGFIRGGSMSHLAKYDFSYYYLILAALVLQILVNPVTKLWPIPYLAYSMLVVSYLLLLSGVWLNRNNEFLFLVLIGLLLNFMVIAVNGGMPVSFGAAQVLGAEKNQYVQVLATDFKHVPLLAKTKLKLLSDIIPIPKPYPFPAIYSIGDVFISMGILFFLQHHMRYLPKHRKQASNQVGQTI